MLKKLDLYIIKTFLGPFIFIFSILFFIFMVNIIWIQMFNLGGKGLTTWELTKLFYYLSVGVIKMVLPLTVLLASIMAFGGFGERYELAAMKAAGAPLIRIIRPLFLTSLVLAFILFLFSNFVIPDFQRKAKNMLYNIVSSKPALNFTPGQFINSLPGTTIKFDRLYGENDELIEGVFINKTASSFDDQRTIIAKRGKIVSKQGSNYLRMVLYDGYIFEDNLAKPNYQDRFRQENQTIKFDSLVSHFDISELLDKAIESEKITDSYEFQNYAQLNSTVDLVKAEKQKRYSEISSDLVSQSSSFIEILDKNKDENKNKKTQAPFSLDSINQDKKLEILFNAHEKIDLIQKNIETKNEEILSHAKLYAKVVMHQQQILAYSVMSVLFLLIGTSLGSIVRKGGIGMPILLSIIIFIIFFVLNISAENMAWKGEMDPYIAAWLPNFIFLPFSIWITYKANTDSQILDVEKYKSWIMPLIKKFSKHKEHKRYQ